MIGFEPAPSKARELPLSYIPIISVGLSGKNWTFILRSQTVCITIILQRVSYHICFPGITN